MEKRMKRTNCYETLCSALGLACAATAGAQSGSNRTVLRLRVFTATLLAAMATVAVAAPPYKYTTPVPSGIAAPKEMPTRFGTLKFFDGVPDQASTQKIYDNLDFQRAVQGYLLGLPAVNQLANRTNILQMGPANPTVPIWEELVD